MQVIQLTVLKRRGVDVNEVQVIDANDICSPIFVDPLGSRFL